MAIEQKTADFARDLFNQLDEHWEGGNKGMSRPGYSFEETNAMNMVTNVAKSELGMEILQDLAGNRYLISSNQENRNFPVRMAGSHVDAVPNGGKYDGPAGVVAPLAALYDLKLKGVEPHQPACVVIWRNEESPWFGQFGVGSKLATGALGKDFLKTAKHKNNGETLETWMDKIGLEPHNLKDQLHKNGTLLNPAYIEGLVETHIEQGSVLEKMRRSLGLVTAIRGNVRFPEFITFEGETGHTGAVPQDQRIDVMRAQALFITMCDQRLENDILSQGKDIVWSYPQGFVTGGGSPTNIADHFQLKPEIRTTDPKVIDLAQKIFADVARNVQQKTGVKISWNKMNIQQPVQMSPDIRSDLLKSASDLGLSAMEMPSGAGHDVQIAAQAGIPGGLIFIRHGNKGASHRPDEILGRDFDDDPFTTSSDFANAVVLNAQWLKGSGQPKQRLKRSFASDLRSRGAWAP